MDRIVYIGPYNNHKSEELFNKAISYLRENKGDRFYYILPNGRLLTRYRKRMIEKVGQTFQINLFTFDNIVDRLLEDYFYINIDGELKEAILSNVVSQLTQEGKVKYYREVASKKGFIKILSNIIGDIKRSLITPEIYLERCPDNLFFKEIGIIYKGYERKLSDFGLIDKEGSFFKSLALLKEDNSFFDDLDFIIIDGFFDFRPQELELLKEISNTKVPMYINMPFNRDYNFNTFTETLTILEGLGFKMEYVDEGELSYFEQMANILFSPDEKQLYPRGNINLIKAPNSFLEIKKIAEEIKRHYVQGVDLEDMALVITNPNDYRDTLFRVFEEERIPCTLNKDIDLIEIPLSREIIYILEISKNNGDKTSMINRIKSNYFSLCPREAREIAEYLLRKSYFNNFEELLNNRQILSFQEFDIKSIILKVEEEAKAIPAAGTVAEYVDLVMDLLRDYNIQEKILEIYGLTKDYGLFRRDITALNKITEILDKLKRFIGILYDEISLDEFIGILRNYFESESIREIEGNAKGVNILSPVTARGQRFKVLFVLGLSQGKYPALLDSNFFINDKNHKTLKNIGLDVKNYYEKLDKESIIFTTIISACSNTLYLSYSENSTGDEKDIPSIFLDEVLNRVRGDSIGEKVNVIRVDMDYILKDKLEEITSKKELSQYLLARYFQGAFEEDLFHMYNHIDSNTFKEVNERIISEVERNREEFNQYSGLIGDEYIIKDLQQIHRNKTYSISYLESYGRCPYQFLLKNVLNVEKMERAFEDFTPLDRGTINHEVLKDYYYNFKGQIEDHILGKRAFNVDDTYEYIVEKIEKLMEEMELNTGSKLWKIRIENNANRILELIKGDLDRLSRLKKKVVPLDFEVPFARDNPFIIEVDGLKIPFTGVIDRIDKYMEEDKYILIDYKNSEYSVKDIDHMRSGLSLQLPVYILSQGDKEVVAGMYGIISKGEFQLKIGNIKEAHLVKKNHKGAIRDEELEELLEITKLTIKSYIDLIHRGDFSVNPKECSPFCIYRDICRYKKTVEVE